MAYENQNLLPVILICFCSMATFAFATSDSQTNCIEVQESTPTLIELLEDGESYSIEITSIGCFNGSRKTLMVSKEGDVFTAHLQDTTKILSEQEIIAFINFELQLRDLSSGACTTVDTYVLRYGNETFRTSDGTCSWNGGRKLLQQLGLA